MESDGTKLVSKSFGRIIGDSLETYGRNFASYLCIAVLAMLPLALCGGLLWALAEFAKTAADGWPDLPRTIVTDYLFPVGVFVLSIPANAIMTGALVHTICRHHLRRPASIRHAYSYALKRMGNLTGTGFLYTIVMTILMASFICLPFAISRNITWLWVFTAAASIGLPFAAYFGIKWRFAMQAVALDGLGPTRAISRSGGLVRGSWWRVFAITAGVYLTLGIIEIAIDAGLSPALRSATVYIVMQVVIALLIIPFSVTVDTLLYFDLRIRKEQYTVDKMADEMGEEVPVPLPAAQPEQSPQIDMEQVKKASRLKPLLIGVAIVITLIAAILTPILVLREHGNSDSTQVFTKRISSGKEVRVSSGLKTIAYTDFTFVVRFNGSVALGDQENTVETHVGSGDLWSDGLAKVRVFAQEGTMEEVNQPGSYNFFFPEDDPSNELSIIVEVMDKDEILISSATGNFPAASQIVLSLDYGDGSGYVARIFTGPSSA
jgi:hypothetical protein